MAWVEAEGNAGRFASALPGFDVEAILMLTRDRNLADFPEAQRRARLRLSPCRVCALRLLRSLWLRAELKPGSPIGPTTNRALAQAELLCAEWT